MTGTAFPIVFGTIRSVDTHTQGAAFFQRPSVERASLTCPPLSRVSMCVCGCSRALPSSPSRRSRCMGLVTALTSASQFLLLPLVQALNTALSPSTTLVILGLASLLSLPAAVLLLEKDLRAPPLPPSPLHAAAPLAKPQHPPTAPLPRPPLHPLDPLPPLLALRLALCTSPLWLLSLAFFTCGYPHNTATTNRHTLRGLM